MLERIHNIFNDIANAIDERGVPVRECDPPETYANKIRIIPDTVNVRIRFIPIFKVAASKPETPTGDVTLYNTPEGWSNTTDGLDGPIWMSYAIAEEGHVYVEWTEPILLTNLVNVNIAFVRTSIDLSEYELLESADYTIPGPAVHSEEPSILLPWSNTIPEGEEDLWMAVEIVGNSWSRPVKITSNSISADNVQVEENETLAQRLDTINNTIANIKNDRVKTESSTVLNTDINTLIKNNFFGIYVGNVLEDQNTNKRVEFKLDNGNVYLIFYDSNGNEVARYPSEEYDTVIVDPRNETISCSEISLADVTYDQNNTWTIVANNTQGDASGLAENLQKVTTYISQIDRIYQFFDGTETTNGVTKYIDPNGVRLDENSIYNGKYFKYELPHSGDSSLSAKYYLIIDSSTYHVSNNDSSGPNHIGSVDLGNGNGSGSESGGYTIGDDNGGDSGNNDPITNPGTVVIGDDPSDPSDPGTVDPVSFLLAVKEEYNAILLQGGTQSGYDLHRGTLRITKGVTLDTHSWETIKMEFIEWTPTPNA